MDRNNPLAEISQTTGVVLLAEDVDRNLPYIKIFDLTHVVLLAEDVDRNTLASSAPTATLTSSSSRRTWIEITLLLACAIFNWLVVLLAEDVDRNP